ncbi:fln [Trypoxylus dichotomus]
MAEDDSGSWFAATDDGPPPRRESLVKKSEIKAAAAAKEEDVEIVEEIVEEEEIQEVEPIDPDKLLLFKHWTRPRFLQYGYLFDYRQNYYNDVIDFLDKRQKGLSRDVPRAQTWAERALRTYNSKIKKYHYYSDRKEDTKLCTKIRLALVDKNFLLVHLKISKRGIVLSNDITGFPPGRITHETENEVEDRRQAELRERVFSAPFGIPPFSTEESR